MPQALVVDDAKVIRLLLAHSLSELGFDVSQAGDGAQAMEALGKAPETELVLVDWNMPVMNGLELVSAIRSNPTYSSLTIVMVTGETDVNHIVTALEAGANDYIMKPFTAEMLAEKLILLGLVEGQLA